MKRICIALATLMAAQPALAGSGAEPIPVRFGTLEIKGEWGDSTLLFNGAAFQPPVNGNNMLSFVETVALKDRDLVIVQDNGGTGCPALFHVIDVSKAGAKATQSFGSCTDLITVKPMPNGVAVTMGGFATASASKSEMARAMKTRHVYRYVNGQLTKNGKPVRDR